MVNILNQFSILEKNKKRQMLTRKQRYKKQAEHEELFAVTVYWWISKLCPSSVSSNYSYYDMLKNNIQLTFCNVHTHRKTIFFQMWFLYSVSHKKTCNNLCLTKLS